MMFKKNNTVKPKQKPKQEVYRLCIGLKDSHMELVWEFKDRKNLETISDRIKQAKGKWVNIGLTIIKTENILYARIDKHTA